MIVIGGGASGLGIAVEASSRKIKTVLLEQYDFAKGTSSKSTKLVHGGVRYLAQGNIKLVSEALEERGLLQKNARHLFKKQKFIIPNYNWWGGPFYTIGLKLYDFLAKKLSLGASKLLKKSTVTTALPTLKKESLKSGVSYFDGQFDDARLAINLAQTTEREGATPLNYMKVVGLLKDEQLRLTGVEVIDTITEKSYKIYAKVIVNATGIFTDKIHKMYNPAHKKTVVPSQGIHLMLEASFLQSEDAIMIPKTSDGRVLFIIPWYDKVIAGTTDTLIKKPKIEPAPLEEEVDFILATINAYLSKKASRKDVLSVFSGLRPLAKPKGDDSNTKEVSRSHKVIIDQNLVSIVGGKWTTYRKMAQDTLDQIFETFQLGSENSNTKSLSLVGNIEEGQAIPPKPFAIYGSQHQEFIKFQQQNKAYSNKIHPSYPYTIAQIIWSIRQEYALTVEDFLSRRIRLLLLDAKAATEAAPAVAKTMAEELGMDATWESQQIETFNELANKYILK